MPLALPAWLTRVESDSMEPTLHDGQLAWTRALRHTDRLQRGDLVVVDSTELGRRIIKRIIGLPAERVVIRGGRVSVDGVALDEPYASASYFDGSFAVPDGSYLLLGDNRDAYQDSRSWENPYISRRQIRGRIRLRHRRARPAPDAPGGRDTGPA
jgi:signal peptidase I